MHNLDWLPFALLAPAMLTMINFGDKFLVESRIPDPFAPLIYLAIVNVGYGIVLWLISGAVFLPLNDAILLMLTGTLVIWGNLFYFQAMAREDASKIVVLIQIGPLYTLVMSVIFLSERPTLQQLVGFVLILGTAVVMSLERHAKRSANDPHQPPANQRLRISRSFWLMLVGTCLWATGGLIGDSILDRYVTDIGTLTMSIAYSSMGYFVGGVALYVLVPRVRKGFHRVLNSVPPSAFIAASGVELIYVLRQYVLFTAIALGPISLIAVLGSTQVFFGILFGWALTLLLPNIFKEDISRPNLFRKSALASVMVIGILLIGG